MTPFFLHFSSFSLNPVFPRGLVRPCLSRDAHGDISNYDPDFLIKLSDKRIVIAETKGQEDLDVPLKMERLRQWCEDINRVQSNVTYDFVYVDADSFEKYKPSSFRHLVDGFREYKERAAGL